MIDKKHNQKQWIILNLTVFCRYLWLVHLMSIRLAERIVIGTELLMLHRGVNHDEKGQSVLIHSHCSRDQYMIYSKIVKDNYYRFGCYFANMGRLNLNRMYDNGKSCWCHRIFEFCQTRNRLSMEVVEKLSWFVERSYERWYRNCDVVQLYHLLNFDGVNSQYILSLFQYKVIEVVAVDCDSSVEATCNPIDTTLARQNMKYDEISHKMNHMHVFDDIN